VIANEIRKETRILRFKQNFGIKLASFNFQIALSSITAKISKGYKKLEKPELIEL